MPRCGKDTEWRLPVNKQCACWFVVIVLEKLYGINVVNTIYSMGATNHPQRVGFCWVLVHYWWIWLILRVEPGLPALLCTTFWAATRRAASRMPVGSKDCAAGKPSSKQKQRWISHFTSHRDSLQEPLNTVFLLGTWNAMGLHKRILPRALFFVTSRSSFPIVPGPNLGPQKMNRSNTKMFIWGFHTWYYPKMDDL